MMDYQEEREEFEKLPAVAELIKTNDVWWSEVHSDYFGSDHELDCWIGGAWAVWQAKSQAVPHILAARDVLAERDRQINQEHYSTEHDDEYTQNELLRAATCYSSHALARGWVHRSNLDPNTYQSEEAPDLWPWDLDFWKPKSPRHDLVRAAALLIAEIERIDRAQEQSNG